MQKGQALIFILLGIIMIAFVGVAFYAGKITPKPPVQNPAVTSTPQPTSSPSLIDETANWKIYTDTKHRYSVKYPSDQFTNCGNNEVGLYLNSGGEGTRECGLGEEQAEFLIINTTQGTGNFERSDFEQCYSVQKESIIVNGVTGIKYSNIFKNDQGKCAVQAVLSAKHSVHIILNRNGKLYNIAFFEDSDKDIKYKILSTFKFLDQNQVDISSWKTYTNTKDGYSIKYPPQVSVDKNGNFSFIIQNDNYSFGILPSTTPGTSLHELNPSTIDQVVISECPDWGNQKSCSDSKSGPIPGSFQFDLLNRHYASTNTIIKNGNVIYEIDLGINSPNTPISNEVKQIYNQILSTVKFLK